MKNALGFAKLPAMALAVPAFLFLSLCLAGAAPFQNDSPAIDPALRADIQRLLDDVGMKAAAQSMQIDQISNR